MINEAPTNLWLMIIALAASAYLLKMFGLVVLGSRQLPKVFDRCLGLIPAALLSALVLKDRGCSAGSECDGTSASDLVQAQFNYCLQSAARPRKLRFQI
jgi:branched-subunit amino acid transport protein